MLIKLITLNEVWEVLSEGQWGKVHVGGRRREAGQHKLVQQHPAAAEAVRAVLLHETMVCPQQLQPGAPACLDYTDVPSISINCGNSARFLKTTCNFFLAFSVCALLVILSSINCGGVQLQKQSSTPHFGYLASSFEHIQFHLSQLSDDFPLLFFQFCLRISPRIFLDCCDKRMPHR